MGWTWWMAAAALAGHHLAGPEAEGHLQGTGAMGGRVPPMCPDLLSGPSSHPDPAQWSEAANKVCWTRGPHTGHGYQKYLGGGGGSQL